MDGSKDAPRGRRLSTGGRSAHAAVWVRPAAATTGPMGVVVSLILIALGAILTFAVTGEAEGVDLDVVGIILMIVGLIGFLISLMYWSSWGGPGFVRRRGYVEGGAVVRRSYAPRRTEYVEEEDVGPPGPPPP